MTAAPSSPAAALPTPERAEEADWIHAVQHGDPSSFEPLIQRYQGRVFATVRRYARRESEVADVVQAVFIKAFQKLHTFRGDAPFEHWLMRLTVRACFDTLRSHRRNRETPMTDLSIEESHWLANVGLDSSAERARVEGAKQLIARLLDDLSPAARLTITLLDIENRSVKEIAQLTGWSVALVKVRAFRARQQMRRNLRRLGIEKYL